MKATGPFNLIAGQETDLVAPDDQSYTAVVVYNDTGSVIGVGWNGNSDIVQPLTANAYKFTQTNTEIQLNPVSTAAAGTYIGTVTATWYLQQDSQPTNYPQPLIPFPGGATLLASKIPTFTKFLSETNILIRPPAGSGSLTIEQPINPPFPPTQPYLNVIGVQSGQSYLSAGEYGSNPLTVPLINDNIDTDFIVQIDNGTGSSWTFTIPAIYASPGNPPPSGPISTTRVVTTNGGTVLPALSNGAYYIFSWDAFVDTTADTVELTPKPFVAANIISVFYCSTINEWFNSGPLGGSTGLRVEAPNGIQVNDANVSSQGIGVIIRYSVGP